ncbi:uncharacterized protein LOC133038198 [Cannabis sativa]|uniref:uncharacterized protein LOC133038198 n=1 Tax=Cannabis sativa TaxID=3483 RepID=UPI0029CA86E1|nr:uncharacterized protein LOC133038198 [Cannabis sativa]
MTSLTSWKQTIVAAGMSRKEASTEKQKPDTEKVIVKVTMDDIDGEIEYWNSSIVCYVLGANPPLDVLEGFSRRIWKEKVDKAGLLSYGIFLIRFTSVETRDNILNGGYTFFNKRPVIMNAWDPDTNFRKGDILKVPIWIQIKNLELKYWGQNTLFKIIGQIGEPIMVDEVTKMTQKLTFPRILVEVSMEQELPSSIAFEDEHGCITSGELKEDIEVRSGADTDGCTTTGTNSGVNLNTNSGVNPPVAAAESHKGKKPVGLADNDGFKQVHKGLKVNGTTKADSTSTRNAFILLQKQEPKENEGTGILAATRDKTRGGGVPPNPNG